MKKRAIVFAGQGAQFVGMGKDLAEMHPACRALFDQANEVLGFDLARLCFEGPAEELTKSDICQPAIFVVSVACYTALRQMVPGFSMAACAGLSLGEWTALHAAGALRFEDALRVLRARGQFMQEACLEQASGMVSVLGLPLDELQKICAAAGTVIANLNSPEQTVLSGPKQAVAEAEKLAQAAGAKRTVVLQVAGAFHSPLMASAAGKLQNVLQGIELHPPAIPVVANVTGAPHGSPAEIRRRMVEQVTGSVQWVKSVEWLKTDGIVEYVECGPGRVLAGLIKRIDKDALTHSIQDRASLEKAAVALQG